MRNHFIRKIKVILANWKIKDYIRQLSIVVLGIIITFAGSDMLGEYNKQKEVKRALRLVKNELLENKNKIEGAQQQLLLEINAANFLLKYKDNLSQAPQDSLKLYYNIPFQTTLVNYTNDALDLLKSSSLFQQIKDEQLALQLIKIYGNIEEASFIYKSFYDIKGNMNKDIDNNPKIASFYMKKHTAKEIWEFLFTTNEGMTLVKQIPNITNIEYYKIVLKNMDYTINAIEQYN